MITIAYLSKAQQVKSFRPKKTKGKRKPKPDGKTPVPEGNKICACGCGHTKYLHIHHVFFGNGQRRLSNKHHCVEWLDYESHQSSNGIHGSKNPNIKLDYKLKVKHQRRLLKQGMELKEFILLFGMDYDGMGYEAYEKYRLKAS